MLSILQEWNRPYVVSTALHMLDNLGRLEDAHIYAAAAASFTLADAQRILKHHGITTFDTTSSFALLRSCRKALDSPSAEAIIKKMHASNIPIESTHIAALMSCYNVDTSFRPKRETLFLDTQTRPLRVTEAEAQRNGEKVDALYDSAEKTDRIVSVYIEQNYRRTKSPRDVFAQNAEKAFFSLHAEEKKKTHHRGLKPHLWLSLMRVFGKTQDASSARSLLALSIDESVSLPLLNKEYARALGRVPPVMQNAVNVHERKEPTEDDFVFLKDLKGLEERRRREEEEEEEEEEGNVADSIVEALSRDA